MAALIHERLQERADLKNEGLALLASTTRPPKDEARLKEIEARLVVLDTDIARLGKLQEDERAMASRMIPAVQPASGGDRPSGRRFAEMFGTEILSTDGWNSANEFLSVLHNSQFDPRLRATATVGSDVDGGFSVPTQFAAEWLDASLESEIVRPRAQVWPMTSDTRTVPGWDASNSSSTLFGGFSGQWVGETEEITEETPKMRSIKLRAAKLALLTQTSNELLADGLGYDAQLSRAIVAAMGYYLDLTFLTGTGAGQPAGVLGASCTITVAKETNQTAGTILYENLTKMYARMHPACVLNSTWVASTTTIPKLAQLSISIGTGGSHIPVLTESNGQFKILTRPVIFTEKVPVLGTVGDIGLYDFSQYAIGLRKDMSLDRSQHVGFTRDTTYFRGLLRADGMPTWASPYTPRNGDTLSPFVVLATRA